MNPEEIKRYFEKNPPPTEIQWKQWAKITNAQKFLDNCYITITNFKGNIENSPSGWRLKDFYQDMLDKAKQQG